VSESGAYRSIVVVSQSASWLVAQLLRVRYSVAVSGPSELFEPNPSHCLILAPTHKSYLDPWLLMIGLSYRQFRALAPIRTLATQNPRGTLQWFMPLIKIIYWVGGVIELPPEESDDRSLPEKVRGLLVALRHGDVVMIFPEGEIHREREPPIGKFASGVSYVHRRLGAPIVPIAVWLSEQGWPRWRYIVRFASPIRIPDSLDQEAGAEWLRQKVLELYKTIEPREKR
jgi:1-acyl-sn-glycerol-3-phosphate acyltransferase